MALVVPLPSMPVALLVGVRPVASMPVALVGVRPVASMPVALVGVRPVASMPVALVGVRPVASMPVALVGVRPVAPLPSMPVGLNFGERLIANSRGGPSRIGHQSAIRPPTRPPAWS